MSVDRATRGGTMKKQTIRCAIILIGLLVIANGSTIVAAAQSPTTIEPMYVGIARMIPEISISSSGVITCTDLVKLHDGYSANVTWELESGTGNRLTPKYTWRDSGTGSLSLSAKRDAIHGYSYRLKTSVKVYNSSGTLVDDEVKYSRTVSY